MTLTSNSRLRHVAQTPVMELQRPQFKKLEIVNLAVVY